MSQANEEIMNRFVMEVINNKHLVVHALVKAFKVAQKFKTALEHAAAPLPGIENANLDVGMTIEHGNIIIGFQQKYIIHQYPHPYPSVSRIEEM